MYLSSYSQLSDEIYSDDRVSVYTDATGGFVGEYIDVWVSGKSIKSMGRKVALKLYKLLKFGDCLSMRIVCPSSGQTEVFTPECENDLKLFMWKLGLPTIDTLF